jgi:hypothetical protein
MWWHYTMSRLLHIAVLSICISITTTFKVIDTIKRIAF